MHNQHSASGGRGGGSGSGSRAREQQELQAAADAATNLLGDALEHLFQRFAGVDPNRSVLYSEVRSRAQYSSQLSTSVALSCLGKRVCLLQESYTQQLLEGVVTDRSSKFYHIYDNSSQPTTSQAARGGRLLETELCRTE